jgi:hypothetical protein
VSADWPRVIFFNLTGFLSIAVTGLSSRGLVVCVQSQYFPICLNSPPSLNHQKNAVKAQIPGGALLADDILGSNGAVLGACGFAALYCVCLLPTATYKDSRDSAL